MENYLELCRTILEKGVRKMDRTGVGTLSIFGYMMRFDLQQGFPLVTTKRVPFGLIKSELLWLIRGETNIRFLLEHNNHIWDEWAFQNYVQSEEYQGPDMTDFGRRAMADPAFKQVVEEEMRKFAERILADEEFARRWGDLGPVYGRQWRAFTYVDPVDGQVKEVDQLAEAVEMIQRDPHSRRIIVEAWHPGHIRYMALPPCHKSFQFYVAEGRLSCKLEVRSNDIFLGAPFNIAEYALLTHMVAQVTGLEVGELVYSIGDAHIYLNHLEQIRTQLQRQPLPLPRLVLNPEVRNLFEFRVEDIQLEGYQHHPPLYGDVAV